MLIEIKKLNILNDGYKRKISIDRIFVNSSHVVSVTDYDGVRDFLISESADKYKNHNFSIIRINYGRQSEEIIAVGTSVELSEKFLELDKKRLLNG